MTKKKIVPKKLGAKKESLIIDFVNKKKYEQAVLLAGKNADTKKIAVEYDRLGGLMYKIVKGEKEKIETGTYWDFENNKVKWKNG